MLESSAVNNRLLIERLNATGKVFLTRTVLRGQTSLRLGLGNVLTTEQHLRDCWELIQSTFKTMTQAAGTETRA